MSSPMGRLYPWGFHDVDGLQLFVSRGVGGSLVPVRTWAPPDVARILRSYGHRVIKYYSYCDIRAGERMLASFVRITRKEAP